ncbi:MAG: DUF1667 domain-containing protein [Clostridia bacterium]|nr:DUF1667 domain-containing protein [Clostridia bacterium]
MKEYTCILCPKSCRLTVDRDLYELTVSGNECERGKDYAIAEFTNPVRIATFNVAVEKGERAVVSVKTANPVMLAKVLPLARLIKKLKVTAPITCGQTLFSSLLGEKIIATANVAKAVKDE